MVHSRHDADLRHAQSFGLTKLFCLTRLSRSPAGHDPKSCACAPCHSIVASRDTTWQPLSRRITYPPCEHTAVAGDHHQYFATAEDSRPYLALHLTTHWPNPSPQLGHHAPYASWNFPCKAQGADIKSNTDPSLQAPGCLDSRPIACISRMSPNRLCRP